MKERVDRRKLAELIILFAREGTGDRYFGATKLNKLLFAADFLAYGYLGRSITGATYIHQKQGPTPKPADFLSVRDDLIGEGRLVIRSEHTYSGVRQRPVTDDEPNVTLFDSQEIEICYAVIESLKDKNSVETSEWSHKFPGWLYTKEGEEIPYNSVYLWRRIPATADDFEWARQSSISLGVK